MTAEGGDQNLWLTPKFCLPYLCLSIEHKLILVSTYETLTICDVDYWHMWSISDTYPGRHLDLTSTVHMSFICHRHITIIHRTMTMQQAKHPTNIIAVGPNPMDPAWNPNVLISRRLREACSLHASRLAERTTIESSLFLAVDDTSHVKDSNSSDQLIHPLAEISVPRSHCPQPPLDDGITGGGSSVSCDAHIVGMDVKLNPLERAAPHRIVVPGGNEDNSPATINSSSIRGERNGAWDSDNLGAYRSATWNAITALAALCDEVQELDSVFHSQILPSIVLFNAEDEISPSSLRSESSKQNILDEEAQKQRESVLLGSIGRFLPTLQLASNGITRLQRLVKNMVVQLGGCATPSAVPFIIDGNEGSKSLSERNPKNDGLTSPKDANTSTVETVAHNEKAEISLQPPILRSRMPLTHLGKAIGTALRILIAVDNAVSSNRDLQEAWVMYKDVVMEWSEEKRAVNDEFESFERMMVHLDFSLLSARSFISTIEQNFDPRGRFEETGFKLYEEILSIIVSLYGQYCERINTEQESTERLDCVGIYALYVLYRHLLPPNVVPDAKIHRSLWSVFPAMCPILELYGPLHFIPRDFIMLHAPYEAVKGCSADASEIRQSSAALVLKWDGSFKARALKVRLDALGWLAVADTDLSGTVSESDLHHDYDNGFSGASFSLASSVSSIERTTSCILRGIKIAYAASILLRGQLLSHKALGLELDPEHIPSIISLLEVLKSIEKMLRVRRRTAVLSFQRGTLKMIASNILKRFERVRSFVDHYSTMDTAGSSVHAKSCAKISACLFAIEGVLKGTSSFSPVRRHSLYFIIAACMDSLILDALSADDLVAIEGHLKDLNQISSVEEILYQICDCSFMYFYRDLYLSFLEHLLKTSMTSSVVRLQLVLSALSDPERILNRVTHQERSRSCKSLASVTGYQKFLCACIKEGFVDPICEVIEIDLRFAVHSKRDEHQKNLASTFHRGVRNLINLSPLIISQKKIHLKTEIEDHLEKIFYSLCSLNLNDCNTYTDMRFLAKERYGLHILDPYLPDRSFDQSFDFINILTDMDSVVTKFNYNLIEQSFIERRPAHGAKFVLTLNARCLSASLKQHGLGVVELAVNASYRILTKKFQFLTQLLSDDGMKSLLSKELRWVSNQKNEGYSVYPFSRASSFSQEIKKLEMSDSGKSSLNEFRILLTEIGNIVAFVRMMREAKRKFFGDVMSYLPPLIKDIEDKCAYYPDERVRVEESISYTLQMSDTDFVGSFVNDFKSDIDESSNAFYSGFFCMIPALCLSWMEAMTQGREMMHKKNITKDGYYTDDGFAVGAIFSLVILDQIKQYQSLNWFKSVQNKYATDEEDLAEKEVEEEMKTNTKEAVKKSSWLFYGTEHTNQEDSEEMMILKMMRKRLEGNKREMAMLLFSMHSAEVIMQAI